MAKLEEEGNTSWVGITKVKIDRASIQQPNATLNLAFLNPL